AVAAAQQADAEHSCAAGREQVPDGVADDVAARRLDAEPLRAREEEIGFRLRACDVAALDDDGFAGDAERLERSVDLGAAAGSGDTVDDAELAQVGEELDCSRERPALGQELAEDRAVPLLDLLGLVRRERAADLPRHRAREEPAAHSDPAVDAPA